MLMPKLLGSALAIIVVAVVSAPAQNKPTPSSIIPTVRFCELTTHPEKYLNKLVRTEASFVVWWESSYFYSDSCKGNDHELSSAPDCSDTDKKCLTLFSLQWKKLDRHMRSQKGGTSRVKAVFIGRLVGPGEFGHLGSFKYEFRIRSVERVSPIPRVFRKGL
ncbi:MAG: hypothetical protein M3R69_07570 [Acidobacteriota bacterium]|nr:hypothetical protein [Acidobacteriota bacterium]